MLPSVNAPKLAVVWASPCPLTAVVSGAGAATSVVIGKLASKCFTAAKPAAYNLALQAWHSAILGPHHAGMHSSLSLVSVCRAFRIEIVTSDRLPQIVTWVPTSTTRPVGIWK